MDELTGHSRDSDGARIQFALWNGASVIPLAVRSVGWPAFGSYCLPCWLHEHEFGQGEKCKRMFLAVY